MITDGSQLLLALRKMNLLQRIRMSFAIQFRRQFNIEGTLLHLFEHMVDQAPQETLGNAFRCRVNGSDTAEMNRDFVVIFNDFEFRMINDQPLPA